MIFTPEETKDGLKRLGLVPEARYLRQLLMEELLSVVSPVAPDGAVRADIGRRMFAHELMQRLAFEPHERRDDGPTATDIAERTRSRSTGDQRKPLARRVPEHGDEHR